jgi:peroxiredoxin
MSLTYSTPAKVGTKAPDFNLPGTDGKDYFLDSFKDVKGLVVAFTCNHCPYAKASWPLLIKLADEFDSHGISFVAINPNDENLYPEDSFDMMKKKVSEWGINFPYLRDESQKVAKEYKAVCTPDIFVFDKDKKLYYHGRINDNWQEPEKVTREDLKATLNSLLEGKNPPPGQKPSMGCSIKWRN